MTAPILTGLAPTVTFAENTVNAGAQRLFGDVTLSDTEGFSGGVLQVTGLLAEDEVSILDGGFGAGAIGLSGAFVTYGGALIGTFSGGNGRDLRIDLDEGATVAAIEALIGSIAYANADDAPTEDRTLRLQLENASGAGIGSSTFSRLPDDDNPFHGFFVGERSAPTFGDMDGDGDLDLVVGQYDGTLRVFRNALGQFSELAPYASPFYGVDVIRRGKPVFADINADGKLDVVIGSSHGTLHAFAGDGAGAWVELTGADNLFDGVGVSSSSAPAFADIDGDGDLDLVVGEVQGALRAFAGDGAGGFAELTWVANPFYGVDLGLDSAPAFADIDGDGDLDAVVGEINGTLRTFANDGAGGFAELTGAANPFNGIDVGYYSSPGFVDLDGDGDLDAVIGAADTLRTYEQVQTGLEVTVTVNAQSERSTLTGVAPSASFSQNSLNAGPQLLYDDVTLSVPNGVAGGALFVRGLLAEDTVSILDGGTGAGMIGLSGEDVTWGGAIIGTLTGGVGTDLRVDLQGGATAAAVEALIESITYANASDAPTEERTLRLELRDTAGALFNTSPFAELVGAANPLGGVDTGEFSKSAFADIDGDGDLDAVVGASDGTLRTFANDGAGGFAELTGADNPFDGVDVGEISAPAFADIDGDGDLDAVVGELYGTLRTFANDGAGGFAELTGAANPFNGIDVGYYSAPAFADIDGDGDLDAVIGEFYGTLRTFANDGAAGFAELTGADNPFGAVTTEGFSAPAFVDLDGDGDLDAVVGSYGDLDAVVGEYYGTLRAFANDGAGGFAELADADNPLSDIDVGLLSTPSFADIDDDGDLDAVVGELYGRLRVYADAVNLETVVSAAAEAQAPVLTGLPPSVTLAENAVNAAPQLLFGDVTLTDPEGFAGGVLQVTGVLAEDVVSVLDGAMIAMSGADVTFGGAVIGTLSGGLGADLRIDLQGGATAAAVEALIESLALSNAGDMPTAARTLRLHLADGTGEVLSPAAYTPLTGAANPLGGVDLFFNSAPAFADIDGDGDLDVVAGGQPGKLHLFSNNGAGVFAELTGAANPFNSIDVSFNSAPAFADVDGDGDLDAVVGDFDGFVHVFANNGAGAFSPLTGAANPFDGLDIGHDATPSFVDIDGDGDLDAVIGDAFGALRVFGNDGAGVFAERTGAANPFDGVDVGYDSAPAFMDIDGDGDLDAVVGDRDGALHAFVNDGAGGFAELTGAANPLAGIVFAGAGKPSFGDLDGDGDLDVLIGLDDGTLGAFAYDADGLAVHVAIAAQNDAPALTDAAPTVSFAESTVNVAAQLLFGDVTLSDAEGHVPTLLRVTGLLAEDSVSVQAGGLLGLSGADVTYIGATIGTMSGGDGAELRIELLGTASSAAVEALIEGLAYANASDDPTADRNLQLHLSDRYQELTGAANPLGGVDLGGDSAPSFVDFDGDGDLDAVVGDRYGALHAFANNGAEGFAELISTANPFDGVNVAGASGPAFADVNADGHVDAVIGVDNGGLQVFAGDGAGGFAPLLGAANPFNGVNAGAFSMPAFADLDGDGDLDAVVGALDGALRAFAGDGAGGFTELTGAANPFSGINVGQFSAPAFADIDGDGDLDAVVGELFGSLRSYANDGAGGYGELLGAANPFNNVDAGYVGVPAFADIDGDGDLDLVVGGNGGALRVFANDASALAVDIAVNVVAENDGPTAQDDAFATGEAAAISGSVFADNGMGADADPDGGTLSVTAVNGAAVGAPITLASGALLTLRADGTFDYDPAGAFGALMTGQTGVDSFAYTIADGQGGEDTATATIDIAGTTHAPDARLDMLSLDEDTALAGSVFADNGFGADGDLDGDALSVVRVNNSAASVGQAITLSSGAQLTLNADGTFDYDPMGAFDWLPAGDGALDSFSYAMSDGTALDSAVVMLTVTGVNDAPKITTPAAFTVAPGATAVGAVAAIDAEGSAVSYAIVGGADAALFAIDAASGALSFLAPPSGGSYDVTVAASDGAASAQQAVAVTVPSHGAAIGEVMQLTVSSTWQVLSFANTYVDPVVFALAPTLNEADAAATRFKNITGAGAEIRLQENKIAWDEDLGEFAPNSGEHGDEAITFLVMERGVHTLEDGTVIQVGEVSTSKLYVKGFEDIAFDETFDTTPSIFSQVQTVNGSDFIISRQRNPDGSGFQLTMQEEQADNLNHAAEDVGWMAIEHGSGALSTMDWRAGSSSQNVNGKLTNVHFGATFEEAPLVVASLASYNGTDTSSPRIGAITASKFTAMALEDQSYDIETNHGYEIVDWMAFSQAGTIYEAAPELAFSVAAPGQTVAEMGFAEASSVAVTVSFGSQFEHPVVIASLTSMAEGAAAIARVFNVTEAGFDLIVQTPDGAAHGAETVSWMVVEAGSWQLADGTMLQAGLTDPGAGFTSVVFDAGFADGPAVLSQTQTMGADAFVKTRMQGADSAGFEVALEGSEAADAAAETVGWIAVDMGVALDADGFVFEAGEVGANQKWAAETFDAEFDAPGMVAGMASRNGTDAAAARLGAITDQGFQIRAEEDQTHDAETFHATEQFHWIAFDQGQIWGEAIG